MKIDRIHILLYLVWAGIFENFHDFWCKNQRISSKELKNEYFHTNQMVIWWFMKEKWCVKNSSYNNQLFVWLPPNLFYFVLFRFFYKKIYHTNKTNHNQKRTKQFKTFQKQTTGYPYHKFFIPYPEILIPKNKNNFLRLKRLNFIPEFMKLWIDWD